ncbi:hypothetical protein M3603_08420 [Rummeliibacillus stabekisii]|uniref:hypothetical protein n=1 Tax=Rummeliibacillus stabekisii TaxID=241244 RepID=UPI002041E89D|nr:hypothetical protein [Rummeliibacillus stabekisii]MCM3316701.1 hypothetical protein [Rummeliibacillus stabekisii]
MHKYLVKIRLINGQQLDFRTNIDVREIKPVRIDELGGSEMLIIDDELMLDMVEIEKIEVKDLPIFPVQ